MRLNIKISANYFALGILRRKQNCSPIHARFQRKEVKNVSMASFFIRSSWSCIQYIGTHTPTHQEWSSCFYFEPTVNRKWIMRYKQNTWPIHMANNICIQYQANVFCFWYPLNFMFAAAATCRFAESNLYHVFKTSRNCSARKHNKFGCVSVKVIHTLALFNLNSFWHSKNQMHKIIHRSIDYFEKKKLRTKTKKKHI